MDRSKDRFLAVAESAEQAGLIVHRVKAVDGSMVDIKSCSKINERAFRICHGKNILKGEAGCYLSHLEALSLIANGEEECAIIAEDDVVFSKDSVKIIEKLHDVDGFDIIKLINHRSKLYHQHLKVDDDISIGRFMHGPLGSSAAYVVTKQGAKKLIKKLHPMKLPFDTALERGWTGFSFFSTNRGIVSFHPEFASTIVAGENNYHKSKLPNYKRIGTLFFRIIDYVRRIIYAIMPSHLKIIKKG